MDRAFSFIGIGLLFWGSAAIVMHFIVPFVFDGGWLQIAFWVGNFLIPIPVLPLLARMTNRTKHDMVVPILLVALPAMTLDGLSITFDTLSRTHIYANSPELAGLTGGFLLFAFASFFFWALVWHRD